MKGQVRMDEPDHSERETTGAAWAGAFCFVALLVFIGTLVYLTHNHWRF